MRTNANAWRWSRRKERAALLVAQDELSDREIAAACKVHVATLERWKRAPEFARRVEEHRAIWREAVRNHGIAIKERRVLALADKVARLERVIAERAADMAEGVPGGSTGLLVRQLKTIGAGRQQQVIEEYAVDIGLLKEYREYLKQVAQELGDWVDKREDKLGMTDQFLQALREFGRGYRT